jgi:diguanylate cyclase (GGDEF)-like protein
MKIPALRSRAYILLAVAWTLLVVLADCLTTNHLEMAPLYLPAIFVFAWYAPLAAGIWLCLGITVVWFFGSVLAGLRYERWYIFVWDFLGRFGAYLLLYIVVAQWKKQRTYAGKDPVTGVANNRTLANYAAREIDRCTRAGDPITLGYLDCDNFKKFNDRWGHQAGDQLLRLVARTLRQHVRPTDLVARVGGDEFIVMLPRTGREEAPKIFGELQDHIRELAVECGILVSFSVGVVTFEEAPPSVREMLKQADQLMYEVKKAGKNAFLHHTVPAPAKEISRAHGGG